MYDLWYTYSCRTVSRAYYQETGRTGRDGKSGIAKFIYNENDIVHARNQFIKALPTTAMLKKVYRRLSNYFNIAYGEGVDSKFDLPFADFCRQYELNGIAVYSALQALDRFGVISLDQNFNNRCMVSFRESGTKINEFTRNRAEENAVVQSILRTYGASRAQVVQVNTKLIAVRSNTTEKQVVNTLKDLHDKELIHLKLTRTDTTVTFLKPREDDRTINSFAREIEAYNATKAAKLEAMIALLERRECVERQLLRYFGEVMQDDCGRCNYCTVQWRGSKEPKSKIINILANNECSVIEIAQKSELDKRVVIECLRELIEQDIIINIAPQRFKLKNG